MFLVKRISKDLALDGKISSKIQKFLTIVKDFTDFFADNYVNPAFNWL